jgi:hypothetical protein
VRLGLVGKCPDHGVELRQFFLHLPSLAAWLPLEMCISDASTALPPAKLLRGWHVVCPKETMMLLP